MCNTMVNEWKLNEPYSSIKLCRAIKPHPCIYDRNNSQYLKREATEPAWKVIAKHCKISVDLCKVRWSNIRAAYRRSKVRNRGYYLHDELKFYWPQLPNVNSEQDDCSDDKGTYEVINKISGQSRTDMFSDNEDDDYVVRGEKEQTQTEAIEKSTKRSIPQKTKPQTFNIKKKPKKSVTLILKRYERPEKVDYQSEINGTGLNDLNANKIATPKNHGRLKRGIDKKITKEVSVRIRKGDEKRMRLPYHETPEGNAATLDDLKMNAASIPMEQEENHDATVQLNLDQHTLPEREHNENENNSTVPVVCTDRVEKSNKNVSRDKSDEDFLNMLRPRLQEMNMRKKLKFQMKVFECLISTLDDTTDSPAVGHEMQITENMPIESTIVDRLRSIHELIANLQTSVVPKPTTADAATTITNDIVRETIVTPDKIVSNNDKNQNSIKHPLTSGVGTFIIPRAPDTVSNTLVSATSRFERSNSVITTTANGSAKNPTTTNSTSSAKDISLLKNNRRYSISGDSPPSHMTSEPPQQVITTSANIPSTMWNSSNAVKPRRITRSLTIDQFNEPERRRQNTDTLLVPRTVAANITLTTSTITRPTSSVAGNASSTQSSYNQYILPFDQTKQQSSVVPGVLTAIRTTTPSVVDSGTGSTTVTISTLGQPETLSFLDTAIEPTISLQSLVKKLNKDVNMRESAAATFTPDEFSIFDENSP